jgi:hypothetical protein
LNKKLLTADQLKRLAQGLNSRIDSAVLKENTRATKEETRLDTKINNTTEMLGGRSLVYLTSVEYERLSDADKNDESKVYIITDAEDISHEHDNKDFLDKLSDFNIFIGNKYQAVNGDDLIFDLVDIGAAEKDHTHEEMLSLIETIILKSSGNKLYEISITPDGNLTTELITSGTEEEIILKDQFDTLFKLSVDNSGALYLEETTEGEYKHIYMQAKYPYAEIFRLGIHTDDEEGSVIVASSLNQNVIKDKGVYNNYTWSSIRILEQINTVDYKIDSAKEEISQEISQKIGGIDFSSYATKEELNNLDNKIDTEISQKIDGIDFSSYATKTEVNTQVSTINTQVSTINTNLSSTTSKLGNLNSLSTSAKGNLVAAINEVFQSGANIKNQLVDVLRAKGISTVSASSSWTDIINTISSPNFTYREQKWYVENVTGAQYNFNPISGGWYESANRGVNSTYALCKLVISNPLRKNVTMSYIQSSEQNFDYAIVSNLNKTLSLSSSADSDYLLNCKGFSSTTAQNLDLGIVDGFYYIKYRKDGSDGLGNDSFRFKITFS